MHADWYSNGIREGAHARIQRTCFQRYEQQLHGRFYFMVGFVCKYYPGEWVFILKQTAVVNIMIIFTQPAVATVTAADVCYCCDRTRLWLSAHVSCYYSLPASVTLFDTRPPIKSVVQNIGKPKQIQSHLRRTLTIDQIIQKYRECTFAPSCIS